jgi:hypothetical protein
MNYNGKKMLTDAIEWRTVPTCMNYEVSSTGLLRNKTTQKLISLNNIENGYIKVCINDNTDKRKTTRLHRLIAMTFIPNPQNYETVNHIDHNTLNNTVSNLEWASVSEQNNHKRKPNPENQMYVSSRAVWRLDKDTSERLEKYDTIMLASKWVFNNGLTKVKEFNAGNNIKTKICAVTRKRIDKYDNGNYPRVTAFGYKWEYDDEATLEDEVWRDIPSHLINGTEGYKVSNMGRVMNAKGRITEGHSKPNSYKWVSIYPKQYLLHRIVAKTFIDNDDREKTLVNHKDGDKTNSKASNLEWITPSGNSIHAYTSNLCKNKCMQIKVVDIDTCENTIFRSAYNAGRTLRLDPKSIKKYLDTNENYKGKWTFHTHFT